MNRAARPCVFRRYRQRRRLWYNRAAKKFTSENCAESRRYG